MNKLKLDRMVVDDAGSNPRMIADAIHAQLGGIKGSVPIREVAHELDILEIRSEPILSFEGALVTTAERGYGSILVNANSNPQRKRFTIAHELGHFLNPWHMPTTAVGFECSKHDMIESANSKANRHLKQEIEANIFAIELLVPRNQLYQFTETDPEIEAVLIMASKFDVSKQASARRYVELHNEPLAVVFSKNGRMLYASRSEKFPWLCLKRGELLPSEPDSNNNKNLGRLEEVDASLWLEKPVKVDLSTQTLQQQGGHAMTLLYACCHSDECDEEIEDSFNHFAQYNEHRQE